jgi:hypothetical protein
MKHGKKPTREQRKLMEKYKVNTQDWLVERETLTELVLLHRHFDNKTKIIPKGVMEDGRA